MKKAHANGGKWKKVGEANCLRSALETTNQIKTITTLTEQLEFSENERRIARSKHLESVERIQAACNDSKNRMLEACVTK
jgi:hypothetical protein